MKTPRACYVVVISALIGVWTRGFAGAPQFEQVASFSGYSTVSSPVAGFALDRQSKTVPAAYFLYRDPSTSKYWVWVTDGTPSGTRLAVSYPTGGWVPVTDPSLGAYVMGQTPEKGFQLYKTQGSAASTQLLVDLSPLQLLALDGQLSGNPVYEVSDAGTDSIWLANGLSGTTKKIGTASWPSIAVSDDAGFVISGQSPNYVVSTFSVAVPSLAPLAAVPPDSSWIYPHRLGAGRMVVCLKNLHQESTTIQEELYCSDGTPAGTRRIVPPSIGTGLWLPDNVTFTRLGSRLLFITASGGGYSPWVTDGTDDGTYPLFDTEFDYQQCTDDRGGSIYFVGAAPQDHPQRYLWRTDGTRANTKRVMPVESPNDYCGLLGTSLRPQGPAFLSLGNVLYQSDGSQAGTKPVTGAPLVYGLTIVGNWLLAFNTTNTEVDLLRLDLDRVFAEGFEQ